MAQEKENWINKTLASLDGIAPAAAPAGLHQKIMQRVDAGKLGIALDTLSIQTVYRIAAAIAVIITLNAYSCIVFSKNVTGKKEAQAFAKAYSLSDNDSFLNM